MKTLSKKSKRIWKNTVSKNSQAQTHLKPWRTSLRIRVALGVALPILAVSIVLSLMRYKYECQVLETQAQLTALQLGEVVMGSLRSAMLHDQHRILAETLNYVDGMKVFQQVQIVDLDGRVKANSNDVDIDMIRHNDDMGCVECHQFSLGSRPQTIRLSSSPQVLRIAVPLTNDSDCVGCHKQEQKHLGILLLDIPAVNIGENLRQNLQIDLAISMGSTILITLGMYLLTHWLVVRRVEAFRPALDRLAAGDFTARLPLPPTPVHELDELAGAFNHMAGELDRRAREREEHDQLRQQAMAEERGRIARELHDGLAQLLGYVNTKAMAVRLMLKKQQLDAAEKTLLQLEEAARGLFVEVREAILDLKTASNKDAGIIEMFKDYTSQFSRLSELPTELIFAPAVEDLLLSTDTKLQLLRIVQEALTNVRKHASATRVYVSLQTDGQVLDLIIADNGQGFDLDFVQANSPLHFGLSTMCERTETIGADFNVNTEPGGGTRIIVRLPLNDLS